MSCKNSGTSIVWVLILLPTIISNNNHQSASVYFTFTDISFSNVSNIKYPRGPAEQTSMS